MAFCCDELRDAIETTFFNPVPGQLDWLAYGTDFETVSRGVPEIRFWPVRFCPFCGHALPSLSKPIGRQRPIE